MIILNFETKLIGYLKNAKKITGQLRNNIIN